jgi:hypothetical protein
MRIAIFALLGVIAFGGCTPLQRSYFIDQSTETPQSQPIQWGEFTLQINSCRWINAAMVIELTWTSNANAPAIPRDCPTFQLHSADDKFFGPDDSRFIDAIEGSNLNPGMSRKFTLSFSIPRGDYKLYVENAGPMQFGGVRSSGPVVAVWTLQPS